jgi:hypothetical protein
MSDPIFLAGSAMAAALVIAAQSMALVDLLDRSAEISSSDAVNRRRLIAEQLRRVSNVTSANASARGVA